MTTKKKHQFRSSIAAAWRGVAHAYRSEPNFRWQLIVSALVIACAVYFPLRTWEIIVVVLLVTLVLTMEMLNTVVEYFADLLKPRLHQYVQLIKDVSAGAVLITSLGAVIIGTIIFAPHFLALLK
jgi:diacylglycerol kinase